MEFLSSGSTSNCRRKLRWTVITDVVFAYSTAQNAFCCLVGAILNILCPRERRGFQSKLGVSSSNQCNLHHSPHPGHLEKIKIKKRVQSFSDTVYMPFNSPFSYPLMHCPITYISETESFYKPRNLYFLEFNMTCKNLWDQTNSIYMHFILGFKCHVFNAWEWSLWPKHVSCVDGINKICCVWQLYVYQYLNPRKAKQYSINEYLEYMESK